MYRDVRDLTKDELDELRWSYYWQLVDCGEDDGIDYADDIPDDVLFDHYSGISFVEDDFFCNIKDDNYEGCGAAYEGV